MTTTKAAKKAAVAQAAPQSIPPAPPKLHQSRIFGAEFTQANWVVTPEPGTPFETLLTREYWAHVAGRLEPDALVTVKPEERNYFAVLIVDAVGPNWASVEVIQKVDRETVPNMAARTDQFGVKWVSPPLKYCVIRKSDNERVSEGHSKEAEAWAWLAQNESRLANAA